MADVPERPEVLARLRLVGTVHGDPGGFKELKKLLESLKPDLIFVELSPFAWAFRKRHQVCFQKTLHNNLMRAAQRLHLPFRDALRHPHITAIRRQISLPFEYRAASSYALAHKAHLFPVDDSLFSQEWIRSWPELVSVENLSVLLRSSLSIPPMEEAYRSASSQIRNKKGTSLWSLPGRSGQEKEMWEKRERHMASQIEKTLFALHSAEAVYVGGWWHLTSNETLPTLRDLLGIGSPRCILLREDEYKE